MKWLSARRAAAHLAAALRHRSDLPVALVLLALAVLELAALAAWRLSLVTGWAVAGVLVTAGGAVLILTGRTPTAMRGARYA